MPIINMQGSLASSSSREKPASLRPEVQDKTPALDGHALTDERVVENTFINKTSVNEDVYADRQSYIAGFPEGRILVVTYFSQNRPITDTQSSVVDLSMSTKDDTHIAWTEIRNFELRCSSEIRFEYEQDSNRSKVNGEAIVFPRFSPRIGDMFIYELRNGKIGQFYVSGVNRLALGQDTYHSITFTLQSYLTADERDRLRKQTTVVSYFDKQKYLVGNTAMLTTVGYSQKKDLLHIRSEIVEDYCERFYSSDYSTFMRPDEIYDPYVVGYWNNVVSIRETPQGMRPLQLLVSMSNYSKTIWGLLTTNPIKNLKNVDRYVEIKTFNSTFWGANITALLNNKFIAIGKEAQTYDSQLIDKSGKPIFYDPTTIYHQHVPYDIAQKKINMEFKKRRTEFFEKSFPDVEFSRYRDGGPYPIRSDEELINIWKIIHGYKDDDLIDETLQQYARGYILWYRETYPGTLSDKELIRDWKYINKLEQDAVLTAEQDQQLASYILAYRSKYSSSTTSSTILDPAGKLAFLYYPVYHKRHHAPVRDDIQDVDTDNLYIFSSAFYEGDIDNMNAFEKLIYQAITNQELDIALILDLVTEYKDWSDEDAFYKHLLSLYLIAKALHWLTYH